MTARPTNPIRHLPAIVAGQDIQVVAVETTSNVIITDLHRSGHALVYRTTRCGHTLHVENQESTMLAFRRIPDKNSILLHVAILHIGVPYRPCRFAYRHGVGDFI
jgi:hypothetical protein